MRDGGLDYQNVETGTEKILSLISLRIWSFDSITMTYLMHVQCTVGKIQCIYGKFESENVCFEVYQVCTKYFIQFS